MAGLLTALIVPFCPNYYKSQASILPADSGGAGMNDISSVAEVFGIESDGFGSGDANWDDILNSRELKENLLSTEFKFRVPSYPFGSERVHRETLFSYLGQRNMDQALEKLDQDLSAYSDEKSNIITITMESKSSELSQQVVRRATELLERFIIQMKQTRAREKAAFVTARLAEASKEMKKIEDEFRAFMIDNRNYQTSNDPKVRLSRDRMGAKLQFHRNLVGTLSTAKEQALLDAQNNIPVLNVLDPGNLPTDKSWPPRFSFILIAFILAAGGRCVWENRDWVVTKLLDGR